MSEAAPGRERQEHEMAIRTALVREFDRILEDIRRIRGLLVAFDGEAHGRGFIAVDGVSLETIERQYIEHTLLRVAGNKTTAAEILGIDPSTLHRKLGRWDSQQDEQSPLQAPREGHNVP
jgi:DNA-binding NtrC family response regulator